MKDGMAEAAKEEENAEDEMMADDTKVTANTEDKSMVQEEPLVMSKKPSMGGTQNFDEGIYESIMSRK